MPLFDSLSTSQIHRLPKMNSVPTTDDLRYAIAEGQKRIVKQSNYHLSIRAIISSLSLSSIFQSATKTLRPGHCREAMVQMQSGCGTADLKMF